uniref:PSI domain-containing protein n=1 Tax=Panthera tigris altaica TaxID=74533 RepID=A0A8C9MCY2_PANTA
MAEPQAVKPPAPAPASWPSPYLLHVRVKPWSVQEAGVPCSQNTNRTCEECLKNVSCLWCNTNKACLDYPVTRILPPSSLCTLSSARWGVCWGKSSCSRNSCRVSTVWEGLGVLS